MTVRTPRGDGGFTLVELLVTMTLAVVVLFAILNASDFFATSVRAANDNANAQDTARTEMNKAVTLLRQGRVAVEEMTPIPFEWTPSRSDLTFAAYVAGAGRAQPGEQPGWVRYCATSTTAPATLLVGVRLGDGYAPPGACLASDTTNGWAYTTLLKSTLANPSTLFDFTSAACTGASCLPSAPDIQAVGLAFGVAPSAGSTKTAVLLRDGVSFRNRSASW